jgi:hypothetical protein
MAKNSPKRSRSKGAPEADTHLRSRTDPRQERRYEAKSSLWAVVTVVFASIGAVLAGAGTFGQWLRNEQLGPHPWSPYLLAGGAALLFATALFGQRPAKAVRVGDAGVAQENDAADIDRIEWRDVHRILVSTDTITVQASGHSISVPIGAHPAASARVLAEATARIPKRVENEPGLSVEAPANDDAEIITLDPPQVAGTHCRASDKPIAFEKDARLCGQCGEVYAKDAVPKACLGCDARLRA